MRIINKLQSGGGLPPLASFTSIIKPSTQGQGYPFDTDDDSKDSKKDSKKIGLLTDDMIKMITSEGLSSDVSSLIDNLGVFEDDIYSNPYDLSGAVNSTKYKAILKTLPKIKWEHARLEDAVKEATKNGGLNETAIDSFGYVYVKNFKDNKIKKKSVGTVDLLREVMLTNADLVNIRESDPRFAFNSNLTNTVYNATSIPQITTWIKTVIDNSATVSQKQVGNVSYEKGNIKNGALELGKIVASNNPVDGMYKVAEDTSSNAKAAMSALQYIESVMPSNYKTLLKVKAMMSLHDASEKGFSTVLGMLVGSVISGNSSIEAELMTDPTTGTKIKADGTKSMDDIKNTPAIAFATGMGNYSTYYMNTGGNRMFKMYGFSGIPAMQGDKPLGEDTLVELGKTDLAPVLDFNNVTFGNQRISIAQGNKILVNGNGIVGVDLPIDLIAYQNGKGVIKPDLAVLQQIEKADTIVSSKGLYNKLNYAKQTGNTAEVNNIASQINKIYRDNGLTPKLDGTGELALSYKRFAMISASADETAFNGSLDLQYVKPIEDLNLRKSVQDALHAKDNNYKVNAGNGFLGFGKGNTLYEGTVFIPVNANVTTASLGDKSNLLTMGQATQVEAETQHREFLQKNPYVKSTNFMKGAQ